MAITKYEGKTFTKQSFVVEDSCFVNCVLKECDLFYSGGDSELVGCQLEACQWHFRGPAQKTMQTMQMMGMLKLPQIPVPFPSSGSKMN